MNTNLLTLASFQGVDITTEVVELRLTAIEDSFVSAMDALVTALTAHEAQNILSAHGTIAVTKLDYYDNDKDLIGDHVARLYFGTTPVYVPCRTNIPPP